MAILKLEQLAKGIKFSGESLSNAASVPEEKLVCLPKFVQNNIKSKLF
jgi:hypothetical protein